MITGSRVSVAYDNSKTVYDAFDLDGELKIEANGDLYLSL